MRSASHHASATDCSRVTERPRRKGIVYSDTIGPQIPATNTAAGSISSTELPASSQNVWPRSTFANTLLWNGTIHATPDTTHCTSCWSTKLHCWLCAATSCIGAPERGGRRAHCYKTCSDKSRKGSVMEVTGTLRLAQNAQTALLISVDRKSTRLNSSHRCI